MHEVDEIYPRRKIDRRLVPNLPERGASRRGCDSRYQGEVRISLYDPADKKDVISCDSKDLSRSGALLYWPQDEPLPVVGDKFTASFYLPPGMMPESYESRIRIPASVVRVVPAEDGVEVALNFSSPIDEYLKSRRWRLLTFTAFGCLCISLMAVMYLRQESIFYFVFDIPVFLYGIIASVFLISRFAFALFYRSTPVDPGFTPGVTIVIPCFNEEEWIENTIRCSLDQNYPQEQLEVILVDDGSTDGSLNKAAKFAERIRREISGDRFSIIEQPRNMGKRHAMAAGVLRAKFDLVIFVDSDSFLDPNAVREIVQPFKESEIGAVTGRTEVQNKWTNVITKMQAVRYYVAFRFFKASEGVFEAVTCLSGPLACYRKKLVLKYLDAWLNQTFFGHPATFGDDRSLTNFILQDSCTAYQDSAICSTVVPSRMSTFIRQQMRWKRSWLRETLRASSFMWRKEPFMAMSFYIGFILPVLAPLVVVRTMLVVPLMYGIFPYTYLIGVFVMSTLMSAAYLLLKRSNLWFYGISFCFFYFGVLLWQLPVALCTFWKSEWGTRSTFADASYTATDAPEEAIVTHDAAHSAASKLGVSILPAAPVTAVSITNMPPVAVMAESDLLAARLNMAPQDISGGASVSFFPTARQQQPAAAYEADRAKIVLRILRGEEPEKICLEFGLKKSVLDGWLNAFISAGTREVEDMGRETGGGVLDKISEQSVKLEALSQRIAMLEKSSLGMAEAPDEPGVKKVGYIKSI